MATTTKKTKKTLVKKPTVKATKPPAKKAASKPAPKKATAKTVAAKTVTAPKAPSKKKTPEGMPERMRDLALKILDERQAEEIVTINLTGRSSVADYLIIATGRAGRQVAAIADHLRQAFEQNGLRNIHVEGQGEANWILVDGGDVIVHLFRPEVRRYYDFDGIWQKKGV